MTALRFALSLSLCSIASKASPAYSATLKLGSRAIEDYGLLQSNGCVVPYQMYWHDTYSDKTTQRNDTSTSRWDDLLQACEVSASIPTHMPCVPPPPEELSFQLCVGTCCIVRLGQTPSYNTTTYLLKHEPNHDYDYNEENEPEIIQLSQHKTHMHLTVRIPVQLTRAAKIIGILLCLMIASVVLFTAQHFDSLAKFRGRLPPSWGPHMQQEYPFRKFYNDVTDWLRTTEAPQHLQGWLLKDQLKGLAWQMVDRMPPEEVYAGGLGPDMQWRSPVVLIMDAFRRKFGLLDDDQRLFPLLRFMAFDKLPGESFTCMETRFDMRRQDAEEMSGFIMSVEAISLLFIKCLKLTA